MLNTTNTVQTDQLSSVRLPEKEFVCSLDLTVEVPSPKGYIEVKSSYVDRCGLPLTGFWNYFVGDRPQLLGRNEISYLASLTPMVQSCRLRTLFDYHLPCVIVCSGMSCLTELINAAKLSQTPLYWTRETTTGFMLRIIDYLRVSLIPSCRKQGVLMDINGTGVLITGESGIGKSETALELIKRGHRLVADDSVEIQRISRNRIIGQAPEMIRHFMEIRGIGIIDISMLYGVSAVIDSKSIDLVVELENWSADAEYNRLGTEENFEDILGVQIPRIVIPVRPGRNLAVVMEVASRVHTLRQNGYSAARILNERQERLARQDADEAELNYLTEKEMLGKGKAFYPTFNQQLS